MSEFACRAPAHRRRNRVARPARRAARADDHSRGGRDARRQTCAPLTIWNSTSDSTPCSASSCLATSKNRLAAMSRNRNSPRIYTVRDLVDAVLQSAASGAGSVRSKTAFAGWKAILAEEPDPAEVLALVRPQPVSAAFWYMVSRLIQVIALDRFDLARERNREAAEERRISFFPPIIRAILILSSWPAFFRRLSSTKFLPSAPAKFSAEDSCGDWRVRCASWWSIRMRI